MLHFPSNLSYFPAEREEDIIHNVSFTFLLSGPPISLDPTELRVSLWEKDHIQRQQSPKRDWEPLISLLSTVAIFSEITKLILLVKQTRKFNHKPFKSIKYFKTLNSLI